MSKYLEEEVFLERVHLLVSKKLSALEWFFPSLSLFLDCAGLCNGKVCGQAWATPLVNDVWGGEGKNQDNWVQEEFVHLCETGRLCQAACHPLVHTWERLIRKRLQAAQVFKFFCGGEGEEQVWPFQSLKENASLLRNKSSCQHVWIQQTDLEMAPEGWWAQRTWMGSCNFDPLHMSLSEPAVWDRLPCLFYELIHISIPYLVAVEKKSLSCLSSCLCGCLQ